MHVSCVLVWIQAAVFRHLIQHWQDYQNFASGSSEAEVDAALDKLSLRMCQQHRSNVEREARERLAEEKKRMAMPRFETPQEQEARLQREKERAEFGDVSVTFRLSTPNVKYTYYTDMPEEFYSKDEEEENETTLDGVTLQAVDMESGLIRSQVSVHTRTRSKSHDPNLSTCSKSKFSGCQPSSPKFKPKGNTFITETRHSSALGEFASLRGPLVMSHHEHKPVPDVRNYKHSLTNESPSCAPLENLEQKRRLSSYKQLSPLMSRSNRRPSSVCAKRNNGSKCSSRKKRAQHMETIHMRLSGSEGPHCHYTAGLAETKSRLVISCSSQS